MSPLTLSLDDQLAELVAVMRGSHLELKECLEQFRKKWLTYALLRHDGNSCRAAKELRIHRNTLARLVLELGIDLHAIRAHRRELNSGLPRKQPASVHHGGIHATGD